MKKNLTHMESTQNEIDFADQNIAINNNMDNLMLKKNTVISK